MNRLSVKHVSRLIIHIGQTKTATTTIQSFLHSNQRQIEDWGVHYLARPGKAQSHRFIFHVLQLETFPDSHRLKRISMERLVAQGMAAPGQSTEEVCDQSWSLLRRSFPYDKGLSSLISEELLWHLGGFNPMRRLTLLRTLRRRLLEIADPSRLMVVACLRHQADWSESWHNQLVKDIGNQTPISNFVQHLYRVGALRYAENLGNWRTIFPEAEIVIKDFHGELLIEKVGPGLALLNACGVLQGLSSHEQEMLDYPKPLQESIHPFLHHWITENQPRKDSLDLYKQLVNRLSMQISRISERRFGRKRFTLLTSELITLLDGWAQQNQVADALGEPLRLTSKQPERATMPKQLPPRVQKICREAFTLP